MKQNTRLYIGSVAQFRRLWHHIVPRRRRQLLFLLGLMGSASLAEIISIGAVMPFLTILTIPESVFSAPYMQGLIEIWGITNANQLMLPLTATFVLAALLSGGMRILLLWAQTRLGFSIGADFSALIYKKTLYQPYYIHVSRNSSEVIAGISSKTNTVVFSSLLPLLLLASSSMMLVTIMLALVAIEPYVAMATYAGFGALYSFVAFGTRKRLKRESSRISYQSNRVIKVLQEGLGGIRDVLIDGSQAVYCKSYNDADLALRDAQASISIIGAAPRYLIEPLGIALISVMAYLLSLREGGIDSAIPLLGALAVGAQRMLPILQQIYSSVTAIRGGKDSLEDVLDLLDQPLERHAFETSIKPIKFEDAILLDGVGFKRGENMPWVLRDISVVLPKGSRVGFIGTTGSGKSTLLDIVMALLLPTEGRLFVDGVPITAENFRSWQIHIAHVPQTIYLSDATVAENIAFGVPAEEIDYDRVKIAANQACMGTIVESWVDGYSTVVGENGVRLSGGQRQRIGIARALYKQADVLVFDEATSALDKKTEREIIDAFDHVSQNFTILMVAHRLTTLQNCDLIFEIEDGGIKRVSSYNDLVIH